MLVKLKQVSELLKIIANENRLAIIYNLIEKPMDVSELYEKLNHMPEAALAQELGILKMNKILDSYKTEQSITYFIVDKRLIDVVETIYNNYVEYTQE